MPQLPVSVIPPWDLMGVPDFGEYWFTHDLPENATAAYKLWADHRNRCDQCTLATSRSLAPAENGDEFRHSYDVCRVGREIHAYWEKLVDKEYKNRT